MELRDSIHSRSFASNLVLDIAKELQTLHICEKWQSSSVIKKMLDDKINKGLITARWIHEVLPAEFKRGYRKHRYEKREVSSISSTQSPICAVSGAQTVVKTIARPERYITITRALPSSHVFDVSSRNLNAGSNETFFRVVIDVDVKHCPKLEDFSVVDDLAYPNSRLNPTYVNVIQGLITAQLTRQGFTLKI
jgi:hypothetical protein